VEAAQLLQKKMAEWRQRGVEWLSREDFAKLLDVFRADPIVSAMFVGLGNGNDDDLREWLLRLIPK
jgi:hypothetical protein